MIVVCILNHIKGNEMDYSKEIEKELIKNNREGIIKTNIIVCEKVYHDLLKRMKLIPAFMQSDLSKGDTLFNLKISLRLGVRDGTWEIF